MRGGLPRSYPVLVVFQGGVGVSTELGHVGIQVRPRLPGSAFLHRLHPRRGRLFRGRRPTQTGSRAAGVSNEGCHPDGGDGSTPLCSPAWQWEFEAGLRLEKRFRFALFWAQQTHTQGHRGHYQQEEHSSQGHDDHQRVATLSRPQGSPRKDFGGSIWPNDLSGGDLAIYPWLFATELSPGICPLPFALGQIPWSFCLC